MPRWLGRILYSLRGKRHVRLHLEAADGSRDLSIEGFLVGRWAGHYILERPKILESAEDTVALEGGAEVPAARVLFVQVLSR